MGVLTNPNPVLFIRHVLRIAALILQNGGWIFVGEEYEFLPINKLQKMVRTSNLTTLKTCFDAGGYAVASMAPPVTGRAAIISSVFGNMAI